MFSNDVILTSILVYCQRRFSQPTNHENVIDLLLVFFFRCIMLAIMLRSHWRDAQWLGRICDFGLMDLILFQIYFDFIFNFSTNSVRR